jgi:hypothetical protein
MSTDEKVDRLYQDFSAFQIGFSAAFWAFFISVHTVGTERDNNEDIDTWSVSSKGGRLDMVLGGV